MGLIDLISGMSTEKKAALGLSAAAGIAGFYASITDEKRAKEAADAAVKEQAYKAGCSVAREFYATKGNPNAKRKKK